MGTMDEVRYSSLESRLILYSTYDIFLELINLTTSIGKRRYFRHAPTGFSIPFLGMPRVLWHRHTNPPYSAFFIGNNFVFSMHDSFALSAGRHNTLFVIQQYVIEIFTELEIMAPAGRKLNRIVKLNYALTNLLNSSSSSYPTKTDKPANSNLYRALLPFRHALSPIEHHLPRRKRHRGYHVLR